MKNINESGRSMVEMLGVLAIIGVLSVGGIAGYSKAMNKYKINKTTDQVSTLVANIRTLFSSQGDYENLTSETAYNYGVIPGDMVTLDGSAFSELKNAFNGPVTILASNARTANDKKPEAFIVEYSGMSNEACITIATGDWGSGQASGLIGMAAGAESEANTAEGLGTIGKLLNEVFITETEGDYTEGGSSLVGVPGGTEQPTPVSVEHAVAVCNGGGAGNAVAWKYY
jgi:type II secretory pathway pseudopilin PulG